MLYWYVNRDEDHYFNINLIISDPIKVNSFFTREWNHIIKSNHKDGVCLFVIARTWK